jgi:hypothetical protein
MKLPIFAIIAVLNYAKTVYPDISNSEISGDSNSVLYGFRESIKIDIANEIFFIGNGQLGLSSGAPAVGQSAVWLMYDPFAGEGQTKSASADIEEPSWAETFFELTGAVLMALRFFVAAFQPDFC